MEREKWVGGGGGGGGGGGRGVGNSASSLRPIQDLSS